jgi:hypothetical protein
MNARVAVDLRRLFIRHSSVCLEPVDRYKRTIPSPSSAALSDFELR